MITVEILVVLSQCKQLNVYKFLSFLSDVCIIKYIGCPRLFCFLSSSNYDITNFTTSKHSNSKTFIHTHTHKDLSSGLAVIQTIRKWLRFSVFTSFERSGSLFTLIKGSVFNAAIFSNVSALRVPSNCICSSSCFLFFFCFMLPYIWSADFKLSVFLSMSLPKHWLFWLPHNSWN